MSSEPCVEHRKAAAAQEPSALTSACVYRLSPRPRTDPDYELLQSRDGVSSVHPAAPGPEERGPHGRSPARSVE